MKLFSVWAISNLKLASINRSSHEYSKDQPKLTISTFQQQRTPIPPPTCSGSLQGIPQAAQMQQQCQQQESLCSEMARELCRAIRCHASSRRRKACEKCSTHVVGYPIDNSTPTPINGVRSQVIIRPTIDRTDRYRDNRPLFCLPKDQLYCAQLKEKLI